MRYRSTYELKSLMGTRVPFRNTCFMKSLLQSPGGEVSQPCEWVGELYVRLLIP